MQPAAKGIRTKKIRAAYQFLEAPRDRYPVETMCRVLDVAPSSYYEWLKHPICNRDQEDARRPGLFRASFRASHGVYGAPRVFLDPRKAGDVCSKHRVERLMQGQWVAPLAWLSDPMSVRRQTCHLGSEDRQAPVYRYDAKSRLSHGYNLYPNEARLALPYRGHESVLSPDCRLGNARNHRALTRTRRRAHGDRSKTAATYFDPLGSGDAVSQRCLAADLQKQSSCTKHGSPRQFAAQDSRRIVLQQPQEGANQEAHLQRSESRYPRCRQLPRSVLEPDAPA